METKLGKFEAAIYPKISGVMGRVRTFCKSHTVIKYPESIAPREPGLYINRAGRWVSADPEEIGPLSVLDFEAKEVSPGIWHPYCCSIYSEGAWLWWQAGQGEMVMPFPKNRIVIGQNSISYDRRYLSCEYGTEPANLSHFDTMQLATIIGGLGGDSDEKRSELLSLYRRFEKQVSEGKPVPQWFEQVGPVGLASLSERYLGIAMSKAVRDDWVKDPTMVQPKTLYQYCCEDVYRTALIFQRIFPKVDEGFVSSPITWYGMLKSAQARYYLKDWQQFLEESETEFDAVKSRLQKLEDKLKQAAWDDADRETNYPDLDWTLYSRGANKGFPKWVKELEGEPMSGNVAAYLLRLAFDGKPVSLRKMPSGQPKWWAGEDPLPHPSGTGNLGTPLCKDYAPMVTNGRLTSAIVPQEVLLKLFDLKSSLTQWTSYRSRYETVYRQKVSPGIELSVADLNTCGTISRRATSSLWVVLPKPSEGKIGSSVMSRIVAPPGHVIVSADFVSQESRIAVQPLTDCRAAKHNSSPWSESVLSGDKSKGTDVHNATAKSLGITRGAAKGINFMIQYMGGLNGLVNQLLLIKGCDRQQAETEAAQFMNHLKGIGGIAETTFSALKYQTFVQDLRTYLLGVKCPNSINYRFVPDDRSFTTLRGNWPIQSAGVDEKHALIALIDFISERRGIPCEFACDIHDRIAYFCPDEHADGLSDVFNLAMGKLMELSLEQGALFWDKIDPQYDNLGNATPREVLQPDPKWCKFEKVYISKTLVEA